MPHGGLVRARFGKYRIFSDGQSLLASPRKYRMTVKLKFWLTRLQVPVDMEIAIFDPHTFASKLSLQKTQEDTKKVTHRRFLRLQASNRGVRPFSERYHGLLNYEVPIILTIEKLDLGFFPQSMYKVTLSMFATLTLASAFAIFVVRELASIATWATVELAGTSHKEE